jgi:2-keto-4-pentenoate hydratase/2-oxohepta-3-ene-1,7-dioic acid hydratase in catechol pathway
VTFALGTFRSDRAFPGLVLADDRVVDLSDEVASTRELFEDWDVAFGRLSERAQRGGGEPLSGLSVLPPVEPRQILQSGANYYKHVLDLIVAERRREGGDPEVARAEGREIMDARVAHGEPYLFLGALTALSGPYDDVVLPADGSQHDWELELAAVIAGDGSVAGYTIANDLTTRDLVYRPDLKAIGTDWLRAKNAPTFLPTGPFIVPAAFVDPSDLRIELRLNGEAMQDESTSDMIFDVDALLAYARRRVRLLPGDLLLTGSPAGNGSHYNRFLQEGDVIEGHITGLGRQRNRVVR